MCEKGILNAYCFHSIASFISLSLLLTVHELTNSHLAYQLDDSQLSNWDGLMHLSFLHSMNGMLGRKWQCGLIPMKLLRASSMIMVKLHFKTLLCYSILNSCLTFSVLSGSWLANKFWSGLLESYYLPRASTYFSHLTESLRQNDKFKLIEWRKQWISQSNKWQEGNELYPVKAKGDALTISQALYEKYFQNKLINH